MFSKKLLFVPLLASGAVGNVGAGVYYSLKNETPKNNLPNLLDHNSEDNQSNNNSDTNSDHTNLQQEQNTKIQLSVDETSETKMPQSQSTSLNTKEEAGTVQIKNVEDPAPPISEPVLPAPEDADVLPTSPEIKVAPKEGSAPEEIVENLDSGKSVNDSDGTNSDSEDTE